MPVALYGCKVWSHMLREEHMGGLREQGIGDIIWAKEGGRLEGLETSV